MSQVLLSWTPLTKFDYVVWNIYAFFWFCILFHDRQNTKQQHKN